MTHMFFAGYFLCKVFECFDDSNIGKGIFYTCLVVLNVIIALCIN